MKTLHFGAALVLLFVAGCVTFESEPPAAPPAPAATSSLETPVPKPATPEALAQGLVEALSAGDLDRARSYFLSAGEFDSLFSWEGGMDPRADLAPRIEASLQRAVAALAGSRYSGIGGSPTVRTLQRGTRLAQVTLEQDTQAIDSVNVRVDVGGVTRTLRLEGLLQVDGYWRIYSPTLEVT
jgi:hypothetical protein